MKIIKVKIEEVQSNPNNPRVIKDYKFKKLVKSIQDFPQMLELRPIIVNDNMIVLGGNMRLRACMEAGLKQIPIIKASELTTEQQQEFIIKDNVAFGEWDWDVLANEWVNDDLYNWGIDIPEWQALNESESESNKNDLNIPKSTDDDYSVYELVMLHENKLLLLETLNKIKTNYLFEKQEDALMELIRVYNKYN
jgi:ParB-like chromosome segregation protein Spo0J